MEEVHEGVYGPHMNGAILAKKLIRQGFFWMTMMEDCIRFVRKCHKCQVHRDISHLPPTELHSISSPWPFSAWRLDIIEKIHPAASNRHRFILVTVDYFTKWVEAKSYAKLGAKQVEKFIRKNLFYRYGIPHHIVSDNDIQF